MNLETLSLIAQIFSFPVAAVALVISIRNNKKAHDLNVVLNLSNYFRNQWESTWRAHIRELEEFQNENKNREIPIHLAEKTSGILNWINFARVVDDGS